MDSPVIVHKPTRIGLNRHRRKPDVGFFNDNESLDANDDQFEDPWLNIASRHPELANLRPWGTWGARKRRGSAAGNERPTVAGDTSDDSRDRYLRDSFFEDLPEQFRGHIPSRWNQRFEPESQSSYSQTPPRHEYHQQRQEPQQENPHTLSNKSTQTPTEETDIRPNLTQHGLRNTVDLGQKTATESDQLDATTARNTRSMSAPPGNRRFSSPHRPSPMGNPGNEKPQPAASNQSDAGNKQPAVRVIPIFVEGRDEPVINDSSETTTNTEEPKHSTQFQDEFFSNHNAPHGFQQPPHKGFSGRQHTSSPFGFNRKFGQQQEPFHQGGMFKKAPTQTAPPKTNEDVRHNANEQFVTPQNVPPPQNNPPQQAPQPQPPPQINDPITKIQLIQKDVLELMTQLENFTGKSKKDKEYIYLDEMLTRNLLKLDVIDTEGKESIRSARKEAIKCIEKCIAVLEAKAESGNNSDTQKTEGDCDNVTNGSVSKSNSAETNRDKCEEDSKLGASDMDVDNAVGQGDKGSATSGAGESMQIDDKSNAEMDVDRPSQ